MVGEFDRRRRALVKAFEQLPGASLVTPKGAFYAFPNLSALGGDSEAIAARLLAETGIAVVPGAAFGEYGEGCVRISYACSLADVENGMAALIDFWRKVVPV
jgi:aspartate/methionine/tyrosine aminotransferase